MEAPLRMEKMSTCRWKTLEKKCFILPCVLFSTGFLIFLGFPTTLGIGIRYRVNLSIYFGRLQQHNHMPMKKDKQIMKRKKDINR